MYLRRKIMLTLIVTIILACIVGFSCAKFVPIQTAGNRNINTIMGNTLSATNNNPNIVVTYDESTSYIDTGDLILTTAPLNEIIKFKVSTINTSDVYVETSLTTAKNSLTAAGTYNLYECSEDNYNQATYTNVSTNCTSIGKTTGNTLPTDGVKVFIHQERSITVPAGGTKYLAFTYTIPASNNEKRYIGVLNTNLKDMTWFDFTYTGDYIDSRVDGIGPIYFTSTGTLTVTNGKTDVAIQLVGGGGGGGGGGGDWTRYDTDYEVLTEYKGGAGYGGNSGKLTTGIVDVANQSYELTVGVAGAEGVDGTSGYRYASGTSGTATNGGQGGTGGTSSAFGLTAAGGYGGSGGGRATSSSDGSGASSISGGAAVIGDYGRGGTGGAYYYNHLGTSGVIILTFN